MKTLVRLRSAMPALAVMAIAFTACGSGSEAGSREPETVELGEQDAGSTVPLRAGDELIITLESNITTGFAWTFVTEPVADVLDLVGSEYVVPETDLVGSGGEEVWTFVATGEGTTGLELSYERASGETSGRTFALSVEVTAGS